MWWQVVAHTELTSAEKVGGAQGRRDIVRIGVGMPLARRGRRMRFPWNFTPYRL